MSILAFGIRDYPNQAGVLITMQGFREKRVTWKLEVFFVSIATSQVWKFHSIDK
jgi:hypothetical protein